MCTVMLALAAAPGVPLAASANRNEFLTRPASPIGFWPEEQGKPRIAAPHDLRAGGTWQGVNDRGLFVCITNRHGAQLDAKRKSRGELVARALGCQSVREARDVFLALHGEHYNGFHLIVSDVREAFVLIGDGKALELRPLGSGVHVITERSYGAGEGAREEQARLDFGELFGAGKVTLESLRAPMTVHSALAEPLESACVHADAFGYGTRSSLQLLVTESAGAQAFFNEGHPCVTPPADVTALIAPFFATGGDDSG